MKMKTEELSILPGNRSKLPSMIWLKVKSFFNEKYSVNWYGLQEHQVLEMARKCRNKLGHGNSISTLENVMDYSKMPSKDRPLLHHSMCSPHPEKSDVMIRVVYRLIRYFGMNPVFSRFFSYRIPKGNSVGKFGILKLVGTPFSQRKGGGASAPFCTLRPPFEEKRSSRHIFKKRVPAKSSKVIPAKSYSKKIPTVIPK